MLRGRKMAPIGTPFVCVIPSNAKGSQYGAERQELCILPGANNIRVHSPRMMIKRMPQPPLRRFGPDETPHFIEFSFVSRLDAQGAATQTRRWHQRGVDGVKRGGFF